MEEAGNFTVTGYIFAQRRRESLKLLAQRHRNCVLQLRPAKLDHFRKVFRLGLHFARELLQSSLQRPA